MIATKLCGFVANARRIASNFSNARRKESFPPQGCRSSLLQLIISYPYYPRNLVSHSYLLSPTAFLSCNGLSSSDISRFHGGPCLGDAMDIVCGSSPELLSDNDKRFASKFLQDVCSILDVKNTLTTTCHPQCYGQVEQSNQTSLPALRSYVADPKKMICLR